MCKDALRAIRCVERALVVLIRIIQYKRVSIAGCLCPQYRRAAIVALPRRIVALFLASGPEAGASATYAPVPVLIVTQVERVA